MHFHKRRLCLAGTLAIILGSMLVSVGVGQKKTDPGESVERPKVAPPKAADPVKKSPRPKPKPTTGTVPSTKTPKKKKPVNPRRIRVFLMDGSVIVGELSVSSIDVQTEFGKLTIPVTKILSITPGLDSHIKLNARINKRIAALGDDDYKTREQSHKDLLAMGTPVRDVVAEFTDDKNAERKRHATEIVKKLDEMEEQQADDFDSDSKLKKYVRHDVVVTRNFTIAGRISPSSFQIASKYGPLKVSLDDIKKTEREFI